MIELFQLNADDLLSCLDLRDLSKTIEWVNYLILTKLNEFVFVQLGSLDHLIKSFAFNLVYKVVRNSWLMCIVP